MDKTIEDLLKKAGTSNNPDDALKFSQAASNAANAMAILRKLPLS
jgi:hypothetical protein